MNFKVSETITALQDYATDSKFKENITIRIPRTNLAILYYSFNKYPEDQSVVEERFDKLNTLILNHFLALKVFSDKYLNGQVSVQAIIDFKHVQNGSFDKFASLRKMIKRNGIMQKLEEMKSEKTAESLVKAVHIRYPDISKSRWGIFAAMTPLQKFHKFSKLMTDFKQISEINIESEVDCSIDNFKNFEPELVNLTSPILVDHLVD
jgi:hypothetical protein